MAKAKRGLIISLFALILAIVVTTSSTYAWFAMNSSVSATNMQVTVRSDNHYLVITPDLDSNNKVYGSETTLALTASNVAVLPATYKDLDGEGPNGFDWYTGTGRGFNDSVIDSNGYIQITGANLTNGKYFTHYSFYVGLNPAVSYDDASNLFISSCTVTNVGGVTDVFKNAVSVLIRANEGTQNEVEDLYIDAGNSWTASNTILQSIINKDGTPIPIDVYVFINGDNSNVTTSNASAVNLGSFAVALGFSATGGLPQQQNP